MVVRRRTELGIRMALGARRSQVAAGVVGQMLVPVVVGIATGVPLAVLMARRAEPLLFGVTSLDATPYVGAGALLALVALVGSWLPARQASSIDPVEAMRTGT
jgi:ABC-type antimicrobial peptide transport system permease subunit